MFEQLGQLLILLPAIGALSLAVHLAGFSKPAEFDDVQEAELIARLTPGGFEPAQAIFGQDQRSVLFLGEDGRLLLVKSHGSQFRQIPLDEHAALSAQPAGLQISNIRGLNQPFEMQLQAELPDWIRPWLAEQDTRS